MATAVSNTSCSSQPVSMGKPGKAFGLLGLSNKPPTHMLLYLNKDTFVGDPGLLLAEEIREARAARIPIAMIHENDEGKNGCPFATFFETTPADLIANGLYKALATAFVSGEEHRKVSVVLFAKVLGANSRLRRSSSSRLFRRSLEGPPSPPVRTTSLHV